MSDHEFRDWDAAYVLGALGPDDRRAFERHIAECAACSNAVTELAGIPGLLGKLSDDEAVALIAVPKAAPASTEPGVVHRLATEVSRRRRKSRMIAAGLGLAAAVGIAFGGIAVGSSLGERPAPVASSDPTVTVALSGVISATVELSDKEWGTRFDWSCDYGYGPWSEDVSYELVVRDAAGVETVIATWLGGGKSAGNLAAASSLATSDVESMEIRDAESGVTLAANQ